MTKGVDLTVLAAEAPCSPSAQGAEAPCSPSTAFLGLFGDMAMLEFEYGTFQ
jgi:hypothetical protein